MSAGFLARRFVAYRDRDAITSAGARRGIFGNYLVRDGRLAGSWRAAGADVTLEPDTPLDSAAAARAAREVARYRRFISG